MTTDQFTDAFEQARAPLKSYLLRITANVMDTEDIVQETYLRAVQKLETFKGDSSIKSWVFAIATNIARDNLRARKRWPETVTDICRDEALANPDYFLEITRLMASSPHTQFEIREHIAFCLTCIAKSLPLEQQICLLLKEFHGFSISEIAGILQVSDAMVKYYLHTARVKMTDIYESRCALINKTGTCHQCSELNGIFNPKQDFEVEKNKIEFARKADNPDREHLLDLRLRIIQEIDPFHSAGSSLQLHHLEHNRKLMEKHPENSC